MTDRQDIPIYLDIARERAGESPEPIPAPLGETNMDTPLAYTVAEACAVTRTGKTVLYEEIKSGALRAVKRGRRTLVLPADLRDWVERLPAIEAMSTDRTDVKTAGLRDRVQRNER